MGNGGTIPPDILTTSQRPDIVVINRDLRQVLLFELTVPWDTNVVTMHDYKQNKYSSLTIDLESKGFVVDLFCFEVSVRGQITKSNCARLKSFLLKTTGLKRRRSIELINNVSKAALLGSFTIFNARNELLWGIERNLSVRINL